MVTYSGGKGICGPQNSGLLAGRADLIEAAFLNYLPGGPRVGIARPAKVSKETIIGLVTAIELVPRLRPRIDMGRLAAESATTSSTGYEESPACGL